MKRLWLFSWFIFAGCLEGYGQHCILGHKEPDAFPIVSDSATPVYTDAGDDWLVQKSAFLFQSDIEKVSGKKPRLLHAMPARAAGLIIIGTLERSKEIQELVRSKKIDAGRIRNQWEAYQVQIVSNPFPGIEKALVIAGSDKRGAAYGVFELSRQMGVSPWYWWADVPVAQQKAVYVKKETYLRDQPKVKYRGIFINDEAPCFSGWAKEKFGGANHHLYEKVFELLLRLKANYLWPAMWDNAFNDDDTLNPVLADKYGIVMGTSHHEPMLRAQQEWKRYGKGDWNYLTNEAALQSFWEKGIENMDAHESIVTIGMRGDGDKPMSDQTATALLERIVSDQRKIIEKMTCKPAAQTPQLWALYKEVQDYYDKGMRVPDDVTLLLCDDNWGNIRRLPRLTDKPRKGGYGIYYHFDYVGGPRNYKWINTNNISRVWEQMHLAYAYGVNRIWIVNAGDLKPMEFPISFFLDYAWNPEKIQAGNLENYFTRWAAEQFGTKYANQIGSVIREYTRYNARRKPELLSPEAYSLTHYDEFQTVVSQYIALRAQAQRIGRLLPEKYQDAFFELVLHPVEASANLNQLYLAAAKNRFFARNKNTGANAYADSVKFFFKRDSLISYQYNHDLAGGKWNHMMDQTHIGYTNWQQPPVNQMPEVEYFNTDSATKPMATWHGIPVRSSKKTDTTAKYPLPLPHSAVNAFFERNGYISMEAAHFSKAVNGPGTHWVVIPGIGRTGSGITSFPVTAPDCKPGGGSPHLEYEWYGYDTGAVKIDAYFSPSLDFHPDDGLKYAISLDNEQPRIISIHGEDQPAGAWEKQVADNVIIRSTHHRVLTPGKHIVKFWVVSSAVVFQKLVLDFGGVKPSYLGPPETKIK